MIGARSSPIYWSIPEMREYVLVDQYQYFVERFFKDERGKWTLTEHRSEADVLALESLNMTMELTELYGDISFEGHGPRVQN